MACLLQQKLGRRRLAVDWQVRARLQLQRPSGAPLGPRPLPAARRCCRAALSRFCSRVWSLGVCSARRAPGAGAARAAAAAGAPQRAWLGALAATRFGCLPPAWPRGGVAGARWLGLRRAAALVASGPGARVADPARALCRAGAPRAAQRARKRHDPAPACTVNIYWEMNAATWPGALERLVNLAAVAPQQPQGTLHTTAAQAAEKHKAVIATNEKVLLAFQAVTRA